jgi:Zn finger protein HypA/HybF involved in hydrogenase expression
MSTKTAELTINQAASEEAECPSCAGSFQYNPATRNLKCPYCDFESEIPDPEDEADRVVQELDFREAANRHGFD